MTPEENELLADVGSLLVLSLTAASFTVFLWGIHGALSIAALVSLWRRTMKARPAQIQFAFVGSIFVLNTFVAATQFTLAVRLIQRLFIRHLDLPLDERLSLSSSDTKSAQRRAFEYLGGINGLVFLVGDVVILWRAWKIWMGRKIFLFFPTLLVFTCLALSLTATMLGIHLPSGGYPNDSPYAITGITAMVCSLAANMVITTMMGIQAYQHRKLMKETFNGRSSRTWRIMFLLTEAGAIYLAIQVILLGIDLANTGSTPSMEYAFNLWTSLARNVSASYPAVVILMVAYNGSLAIDTGISGISDAGTHISFGGPPTGTASRGTELTRKDVSSQQMSRMAVTSHSDHAGVDGAEEKRTYEGA